MRSLMTWQHPENWIHKKFGVEGRDYKDNGDGTYEIINPGDGAVNTEQNLGINLFQDLFARKDAANHCQYRRDDRTL